MILLQKILMNKWTWIVIAILILAFIIFPRLYTKAATAIDNAAIPEPTANDYQNAKNIINAKGYINDDEQAMIESVKQYTSATYPVLKKAYYKLTSKDLNEFLKDELDAAQYAQIALITKY